MSFFVALGIKAETVKELQKGTKEYRESFPAPVVDITARRERQRAMRERTREAKAEQAKSEIVFHQAAAARLARLQKVLERKNE